MNTLTIGTHTNCRSEFLESPDEQKNRAYEQRLKKQCSEFQSILFSYMLKTMRKTVETGELFSGGRAEEVYRSLLDEQYARLLANNSNTPLAESLYDQLSYHLEKNNSSIEKYTF